MIRVSRHKLSEMSFWLGDKAVPSTVCYLKFQFHLQPGPRPAYPPGAQMGGPPRMGMPTMPPHHGYGGEWALLALCLSFIVCVCFLISLDLLCTKFHIMFLYHMFYVICSLILFQFLYLEFSFSVVILLVFVVFLSLSLEKGWGETCIDWSSVHHCKHAII